MAKPKGYISEKYVKKIKEYFVKKEKENESDVKSGCKKPK